MQERKAMLQQKFQEIFPDNKNEIHFFAAPGRVNLIGEHIDYCGGYVFPAALTLDNVVAVAHNGTSIMRMAATDLEGVYSFDLNDIDAARSLKWGNYQAGVANELLKNGYKLVGCDIVYDGTIPFGSGLSSSASIELVTAIAFATMGSPENEINLVNFAVYGQGAENNFCNVSCGIMDQFASAMGKKDNAILLNCETLEYRYIPLKLDGCKIVIGNTCKKRSLAESKYNERRSEVDKAFAILSEYLPGRPNLCSITPEEFEQYKDKIEDEIIRRRAQHVVYENARCLISADLLEANDVVGFGKVMKEANDSIRDLYEVTGFELDTMVAEAMKIDGTIGARMTGAGFGGCTVNIVRDDAVETFIETVGKNYQEKTGLTPKFYVCEIGDGARELK